MVRGLLQVVAAAGNGARTVQAVLQDTVERVARFMDWSVGHAFLSSGPGEPLVSAGAWHLSDPERFDEFRQLTEQTVVHAGSGLVGRVGGTGTAEWITDISTVEAFTRRDIALRVGLRSAVVVPILVDQRVAGVLEFFSASPSPVDDELLYVMVQLGKQLGLVLERARAAEALQASEERNRRIVDTASDAFISTDENGLVVDWNQQAQLTFGWSREEAIGRRLADLIVPDQLREAHHEGLRRYLGAGGTSVVANRFTVEAIHRNGRRFPVELAVWEIATPTGREFNAFLRDVTVQKKTDEALASARDQAIEASRMKSEFLANMSHEIRTPMNGVIGLSTLLMDTDLDPTQRHYAEGIQSAGESLLALIAGILDLSKAEAGKVELDHVDFKLQELIEDVARLLAGSAAAKGVELVAYSEPGLPCIVRGDPDRLRQVLVNLLGNAVKFTERGEVVLRARMERATDKLTAVRFEVRDTGIGIDPATQPGLFQPFTQGDASTTRRYGGTGLGLALSKRLVELMGGEILVKSEVGTGSTFWFTIPLEERPETPGERVPPSAPPSLKGTRVLIVDDNATNRLILEQQLSNWGLRPEAVEGSRQALEAIRTAKDQGKPYALLLLDLQMPEMDGLELADTISGDSSFGRPSIVLLSSVGAVAKATAAVSGVRMSLMKPVRQSELFDALMQALAPDQGQIGRQQGARKHTQRPLEKPGLVLVVEDNPINRDVALGTLAKLGYQTEVATNGREAVDAVSRHAYSAVLMDCQMPEMDGYQATEMIRQREDADRHVPIIAMTASAMAGDRERCLMAGMDDYIAKPLRVEEVNATLARWTGESPVMSHSVETEHDGDGVLDRSQVEEVRALGVEMDNPSLLFELTGKFVQQIPDRLSELSDAAGRHDFDALARSAHNLAGSSAALGARSVASAAAALVVAAQTGDGDAVSEALQKVEGELESASTAMRDLA
jgi:two-component system sensor histidine kinase/response regulator